MRAVGLEQAPQILRRAFYNDDDAVDRGVGLCYNRTFGTGSDLELSRCNRVEKPDATNNNNFAGVAADDYPARDGGQWITIAEPGSYVDVAVQVAATIDTGRLSCVACRTNTDGQAAGRWHQNGAALPGRGSAVPMRTKAAVADDTSVGVIGGNLLSAGTYTTASRTVTFTAAFANAVAGDYVYIYGGGDGAAGGTTRLTVGRYTIESVTSDDAVVLTTAAGTVNGTCFFTCVRGNPTVLAYLEDGAESGLMEYQSLFSGGTAVTGPAMVGGLTILCGGNAFSSADTLADGTYVGQKKAFRLEGAVTAHTLTVTTGQTFNPAGALATAFTTLATVTMAADNGRATLQWMGSAWVPMHFAGCTPA